jgi:hypoxanthine phosphoribosyltransferase
MSAQPVSLEEALAVRASADCIHDGAAVEQALDRMAQEITNGLKHTEPLVVCVLLGALAPFGKLLSRLDFPLHVDYIHATRYRGELQGSDLHWLAGPVVSPASRTVLIVDDILDEGSTLAAIEKHFVDAGASAVHKAVVVRKDRPRQTDIEVDFVGLEVPDRYVFGCGMDYKGYWRNLAGIYAVGEEP